jgi:type IX secretion system PorP/SprF family membrane protein
MKKCLTTVILAISGIAGFAQQDPQFTQFMNAKLFTNPAYAGTGGAICANLLGRTQWTGFPGAPKTYLLCIDAPVTQHFGVGLSVVDDQLGFDQTIGAKLAVSYMMPVMSGLGKLSFGLDLGIQHKTISPNWVAPDGSSTASGNIVDPSIPANFSSTAYDLGFGIYFTHLNGTYLGLSSTHIPDQGESLISKAYKFDVARHYYVTAGTSFNLDGGGDFKLRPNLLVKSDAKVTTFDVNANILWKDMFWLGCSYRMQDAIAPMLGFQKTTGAAKTAFTWKIGYSYDVTTSDIKKYSSGSHEIFLGVCKKLDKEPKPESWEDVRFF